MRIPVVKSLSALALLLAFAPPAPAFNFGNVMNPSRWFNGNRDNYDDRYNDGYYGPPGPAYGYPGAPGYGAPYGAPGYGAPGYGAPGYGVPAYGAPGYASPSASAPAPSATPPNSHNSADQEEIQRLRQRVRELEKARAGTTAPGYSPAPTGAASSGKPISSWQTPMPAAGTGGTSGSWNKTVPSSGTAGSSWQPAGTGSSGGWQPSNTGTTGTTTPAYGTTAPAGSFNSTTGQGTGNYRRPQSQYPGQQSYDLH